MSKRNLPPLSLFARNMSLIPPVLVTVQQARAKNKVWRIEANWQKEQDKGNEETAELWKKQNKQKMKRTWHLLLTKQTQEQTISGRIKKNCRGNGGLLRSRRKTMGYVKWTRHQCTIQQKANLIRPNYQITSPRRCTVWFNAGVYNVPKTNSHRKILGVLWVTILRAHKY